MPNDRVPAQPRPPDPAREPASPVPAPRAAPPRRGLRLRTRPLPSVEQTELWPTEETWSADCLDCDFASAVDARAELVQLLAAHASRTGHLPPPIRVSFVVPHGRGPDAVVSRMSVRVERRTCA